MLNYCQTLVFRLLTDEQEKRDHFNYLEITTMTFVTNYCKKRLPIAIRYYSNNFLVTRLISACLNI